MTHWIKAQNKKEYPFRITQIVYKQLANHYKVPNSEFGKFFGDMANWLPEQIDMLYWLAFKNGAYVEKVAFDMTLEDFEYWTDADETIMEQAVAAMIQSTPDDQKKTPTKAQRRQ